MRYGTHNYGPGIGYGAVCDCSRLMTDAEVSMWGRCSVCERNADAPAGPLYGPPARKAGKAPGEYLVECIAIGDPVKPYRALFASRVERITDHGGSIVLHLENGAQLEQVWGHLVEVVAEPMPAPGPWDCRTPSGHHFSMSFTSDAQRDAVEAHWLDRHDYCKACPECDGCSHPDCDTCDCWVDPSRD